MEVRSSSALAKSVSGHGNTGYCDLRPGKLPFPVRHGFLSPCTPRPCKSVDSST